MRTARGHRAGLRFLAWTLCCALLLSALPAFADGARGAGGEPEAVWQAVGDGTLDQLRGGFDLGGGLMVSFGISRAVYINGELVTQTRLEVGALSSLSAAQAQALGKQLAGLNVVQNGPGNTVGSNTGGLSFGTVIQNSLNNQHIVNETMLNARTNSMSLIKGLNVDSTLADALARSAGAQR